MAQAAGHLIVSSIILFTAPAPDEEGAALRHRGRSVIPDGDLGAGETLRIHSRGHQPVILVIEAHPHHAVLRRVKVPAGNSVLVPAKHLLPPHPRRDQQVVCAMPVLMPSCPLLTREVEVP